VQLRREEIPLRMVLPGLGIVLDGIDHFPADAEAANELLPVNELLGDHRQESGPIVIVEQLLQALAQVHFFPAASVRVLEDARKSHVVDHRLPIEREHQIAKALGVDDAGHILLVGEHYGPRAREAQRARQGGTEELVVGRPHERIVDDGDALKSGVLEVGPIERDLVGDPIDDDSILG